MTLSCHVARVELKWLRVGGLSSTPGLSIFEYAAWWADAGHWTAYDPTYSGTGSGGYGLGQYVWIGVSDKTNEGTFVLEDGTPLSEEVAAYWSYGEPNNANIDGVAAVMLADEGVAAVLEATEGPAIRLRDRDGRVLEGPVARRLGLPPLPTRNRAPQPL